MIKNFRKNWVMSNMFPFKRTRLVILRLILVAPFFLLGAVYLQQSRAQRKQMIASEIEHFRHERFIRYQNIEKGRKGPGEYNEPVPLSEKEKQEGMLAVRSEAFNRIISDKISLERAFKDTRDPKCLQVDYPETLPKATVVIIFHNEAWSPLLRTAHSVVNRSPPQYLQEVILLDDKSDKDFLGEKLEQYVSSTWPDGVVKIVRTSTRSGLIRARIAGAKVATGDVLIFLDSHCEVNVGWIEPLLSRIKENRHAVVVPVMDVIDKDTMTYEGRASQIGGFYWSLHYLWIDVPEREQKRRKSDIEPIRSPTMAGGLFAMERQYFFDLGTYDEKMEVWGGENLEMSFRIWMCGGTLEAVPCSHVGHMFRSHHPYSFLGQHDPHGINSKRLAEVWMDDYKRLFYKTRWDLIDADCGDLSERKTLRNKLKCHSFKWYLENVYPEKFVPDENVQAFGQIRNQKTNLCLDTLHANTKRDFKMGYYQCHVKGASTQLISLDNENRLRIQDACLNVPEQEITDGSVIQGVDCLKKLHHVSKWDHNKVTGTFVERKSGKCLDIDRAKSDKYVVVKSCNGIDSQTWTVPYL